MKKQGRRYNRDYHGLSDRTGILHEHDYVCDKHKSEKTDNKTEAEGIKLGLDLSGGVSITYRIKDKNPSKKDINDTVAKLEERAESYSTEYAVYPVGDDRITVEIPMSMMQMPYLRIWEARDRCILSYRKIRTVMKTTVMTVPQGNTN